jgi:hypothetical protein
MAVSKLSASSGANDFNVNVGGTYTAITFTKEYSSGAYSIVSLNNDTTYDVYIFNSAGTNVGYTKSGSLNASSGFNKMVIIGGITSDVLSFSYKTTYLSLDASAEVGAGPVVTSVSPSAVPNINDTFVITGRNFASDVTVHFTGTAYASTAAKNIVRSSATSLIVTRPDNLPTSGSPYTITVQNPGVTNPTGTNSHILPTSITSGTNPVWVTGSTLSRYTKNVAYSTTLVASDTEASTISYAVTTGSLPAGLSLSTSGVISGTATTSSTQASFTVRATDAGGNFLDRAFTLNNAVPVWVTSGAIDGMTNGVSYSYQLSATDDGSITYTLASGTLPTGITLSSGGLLSGTPSGITSSPISFTFNATDDAGNTVTSSTITVVVTLFAFSSHTFTNAGVTGREGPSLAQARSAYSATSWANTFLNMSTNGIQKWTVPVAGTYRILAVGAVGGRAGDNAIWGYGASMQGDFTLAAGEEVNIVVGQGGVGTPSNGLNMAGGGGGGTAVWTTAASSEPLIVAGGGAGGTDSPTNRSGRHSRISAVTSTTAQPGTRDDGSTRGSGGSGGNGGSVEGSIATSKPSAGAGFKTNGGANGEGNPSYAIKTDARGGLCGANNDSRNNNGGSALHGGFGGGGGSHGWYGCSGGGGGYSGGGAGDDNPRVCGGGGGSYNAGTNQTNTADANTANSSGIGAAGYVTITKL